MASKMARQIGIVLLVVGIGLLAWGYKEYNSTSSKLLRTLRNTATDKGMYLLIGGAACTALGAYNTFRK